MMSALLVGFLTAVLLKDAVRVVILGCILAPLVTIGLLLSADSGTPVYSTFLSSVLWYMGASLGSAFGLMAVVFIQLAFRTTEHKRHLLGRSSNGNFSAVQTSRRLRSHN